MPSVEWEILEGLPPYGPRAEPFGPSGRGTHREGLVVRFHPLGAPSWVGNFQRGWGGGFDAIARHPDGAHLVVVAGALAYVVHATTRRQLVDCFGGDFARVVEIAAIPALALVGLTALTVLFADAQWITPPIAIDSMGHVRVEGTTLVGDAWDAMGHDSHPFEADLLARKVRGGIGRG